jgi:hypothetical protein
MECQFVVVLEKIPAERFIMTEENHCPLCDLSREVFGDRFPNCADLSNQLANEAVDAMIGKVQKLQDEVIAKFDKGELKEADYNSLMQHLKFSMAFAASSIVAIMVIEGPQIPPGEMLKLVEDKIKSVIANLITQRLSNVSGNVGVDVSPEAIEALRKILGGFSPFNSPSPVEQSQANSRKETDPKLN